MYKSNLETAYTQAVRTQSLSKLEKYWQQKLLRGAEKWGKTWLVTWFSWIIQQIVDHNWGPTKRIFNLASLCSSIPDPKNIDFQRLCKTLFKKAI